MTLLEFIQFMLVLMAEVYGFIRARVIRQLITGWSVRTAVRNLNVSSTPLRRCRDSRGGAAVLH